MRTYYVTRDLQPTENFHFLLGDGTLSADMESLLEQAGHVVSLQQAKRIMAEYGKDAIAHIDTESMFCADYRNKVYRVNNGLCVDYFVHL